MAADRQQMATAVYLAQLEANKGQCNCKVCQILRKGNDQTVESFLAPESPAEVLQIGKERLP